MGKCPSCGHKAFFKEKFQCKICGKEICEKCGIYLFKIWSPDNIILDKWFACSIPCMRSLLDEVKKQITSLDTTKLEIVSPMIPQLVKEALLSDKYRRALSYEVKKKGTNFFVIFAPLSEVDLNPRDNIFWRKLNDLIPELESLRMENWIKAGRFEDAAKLLEKRGKYEEAGRIRAKGREIVVKQTSVSVNLNSLLRQIAEQGIVAVYRCPHCGGRLKISKGTSEANLRVCEHCGSEIETMDLADFLKTAIS